MSYYCRAVLGILSFVLLIVGCQQRVSRPRIGDRVTPRLFFPQPWQAGQPTVFGTHLLVQNAQEATGLELDFNDVPLTTTIVASLTFFADEESLGDPQDVPLVRDC